MYKRARSWYDERMTRRYELRLDRSDLATACDDDDCLVSAFVAFVRAFAPDATFTRVAACSIRDARFGDDVAFTFDADSASLVAYARACDASPDDVFDLA